MTAFILGSWFFKEKQRGSHSIENPPPSPQKSALSPAQIAVQRLRADLAKDRPWHSSD